MKLFRKISAVVTAVIGIAVVILGAGLMNETASHAVDENSFRYTASDHVINEYNLKSASFGADFYTYMYRSTDTIVDELDEINKGVASVNKAMETVVKAQNSINEAVTANVLASDDLIETVNKAGGMIVVAMGLGIFVYGLQLVGAAFVPAEVEQKEEPSSADDKETEE